MNYYRPLFLPIKDVAGRDVATVALLVDVSQEINTARLALLLSAVAYLAGSALLFVFFYRLVGWVGQRVEKSQQELEQLATVDQLTGLHNRRMCYSILKAEIAHAERFGRPVSFLMLDIDHFKRVNDTYGHVAGDQVLEQLGLLLKEFVRDGDSVCRYGGEEFAVILRDDDMADAASMAERLRANIEQGGFDVGGGQRLKINVSIGVAAYPESASSIEKLIEAPDTALYAATLARLKAHRSERLEPVLARHGGRLVKLTGNGALVEFSSAVNALGAAIEFQQAMAEANRDQPEDTTIVFRIGLHLGDLIVEGDDLYGDGVNVAARLEGEAPAGGIVISGNVHDAVMGRLKASFDDLGSLALKNIERPVRAFGVKWDAADWPVAASATLPSTTAAMVRFQLGPAQSAAACRCASPAPCRSAATR